MEPGLIINVRHAGKCKLLVVNGSSRVEDIKQKVRINWIQDLTSDFSLHYSVGSISNCVLCSDEDIRNMCFLCQQLGEKIVNVVLNADQNIRNVRNVVCNSANLGNREVMGSSNCSNGSIQTAGVSQCLGSVGEGSNGKMGSSNTRSSESNLQGFVGNMLLGEHPSYDVCPYVKSKNLLSDDWANIMDGGVGSIFRGGAIDFRKEIIKYCASIGFKFKYKRNDSRYIHVVCSDIGKSGCKWFIKGKLQIVSSFFEIVDCNLDHHCRGTLVNDSRKRMGPKVLSELIVQNLKNRPELGGKR